jgi:hypothetical protein
VSVASHTPAKDCRIASFPCTACRSRTAIPGCRKHAKQGLLGRSLGCTWQLSHDMVCSDSVHIIECWSGDWLSDHL